MRRTSLDGSYCKSGSGNGESKASAEIGSVCSCPNDRSRMAGTDKQIFEGISEKKTNGRPPVNRELGYQMIKAGYSTWRIRRVLRCSPKTISRMRKELGERGELVKVDENRLTKAELIFEDECMKAVGIRFDEWVKSKNKGYKGIVSFCQRTWEKVLDKPPLLLMKDRDNNLADKMAMRFLRAFGGDIRRIRPRKRQIRYLFRFLGRQDINDRYLTMSESRDPRSKREYPEITLLDFPTRLEKALTHLRVNNDPKFETMLKLKIVLQLRTGKATEGRELGGLTKGESVGSWLVMRGSEEFRGKIKAKGNETWVIQWIPRPVREQIFEVYQSLEDGEHFISEKEIRQLRAAWYKACEYAGLPPMRLHDSRKISITWLWVMGLPLEVATDMNVGWKDLNTAKAHYLTCRKLLKRTERARYRDKMPAWFKEGLDEYLPF